MGDSRWHPDHQSDSKGGAKPECRTAGDRFGSHGNISWPSAVCAEGEQLSGKREHHAIGRAPDICAGQ